MSTFEEVSASVCSGISGLVDRLEPFSRDEPWKNLEAEHRTNSLPKLASLACQLALNEFVAANQCRRMLESAAVHGYARRSQGLPEFILLSELSLVRQGIWDDLQTRHGNDGSIVAEVILRIDRAFTLAAQASLRGYFRPEFEEKGNWPSAILDLELEWTSLSSPLVRDRGRQGRRTSRRRTRPAGRSRKRAGSKGGGSVLTEPPHSVR